MNNVSQLFKLFWQKCGIVIGNWIHEVIGQFVKWPNQQDLNQRPQLDISQSKYCYCSIMKTTITIMKTIVPLLNYEDNIKSFYSRILMYMQTQVTNLSPTENILTTLGLTFCVGNVSRQHKKISIILIVAENCISDKSSIWRQ